ncbi:helix-turn-helix domain-containing protein [Streptomyces sp. NRRL B-1677]|uniref:XRE family transcriptional regulator n=1 Tax=Streptomyces klenkii TaxID=1420899 RepID=A0A3B0AZC6_9ACTN|nr:MULTISPECIES: helix-turn-helix transcriptional regulator [Streptomyces]MBF6048561.1 helix-turn-helix domain-containing protein [Streptomyces sp. NRRL B-1677]RKN65631.1 XRE family transcriptional regulator [Streptomyces klenkii]
MPAIPTVRRRVLGAELRALREESGHTADEMARRLGWHQTKVSRIENGRSGVRVHELESLLDLYGVTDPEAREGLVGLARDSKARMWWKPYSDVLTQRYASYIALETEASAKRSFETTLLPGLLQTPDYARAVIKALAPETKPDAVDALVSVRLARQSATLRRASPLRLQSVVDEAALRRTTGGSHVMTKQLHHLLEASEEPNVTVQVLPFASGGHLGMLGSFGILHFPIRSDLDIVYTESYVSSMQFERRSDFATYSRMFDTLSASALDEAQSRNLISCVVKDLQ